jgi:hypothetical protein
MNITDSRAYFTFAIELFLYPPIVTGYFLFEWRVKKFLHVSSLVRVSGVIVFIDGLYIGVDEKSLCIHGIWVTKGRSCFSYSTMKMPSLNSNQLRIHEPFFFRG